MVTNPETVEGMLGSLGEQIQYGYYIIICSCACMLLCADFLNVIFPIVRDVVGIEKEKYNLFVFVLFATYDLIPYVHLLHVGMKIGGTVFFPYCVETWWFLIEVQDYHYGILLSQL